LEEVTAIAKAVGLVMLWTHLCEES